VCSSDLGLIERACAHEVHGVLCSVVVAPHCHLAVRTAPDLLPAAAFGRREHRFRRAGENLHLLRLDQHVDGKGTAGLALAVCAMTAVDDERLPAQAVGHMSATAAAG